MALSDPLRLVGHCFQIGYGRKKQAPGSTPNRYCFCTVQDFQTSKPLCFDMFGFHFQKMFGLRLYPS